MDAAPLLAFTAGGGGLDRLRRHQGWTWIEMAARLDLTADILVQIDRRIIPSASLPGVCRSRLATILGIEEAALLAALGVGPPLPARPTSLQPVNPPATRSFAAAIQASRLLTPAQQVGWLGGVPDS